MRVFIGAALGALAISSVPAMAQTGDASFSGPYIGGSVGYSFQSNANESVLFDRGFDGTLDTITTGAGLDAFSPGFCNGAATSTSPATGCTNDKDDIEYNLRAGFDVQTASNWVVGVVGEIGKNEIRDSVSAFSTTPAFYTLTREIDWNANLRLRAGYAAGGKTLFYGTGGAAYAKIDNSFTTSNGLNAFSNTRDKTSSWGWTAGGGVEQLIGNNFSFGVEYLYTRYTSDDYRVQVTQGTALASNPFILNGAPGTEFSRSDRRFDFHSIRATAAFRF